MNGGVTKQFIARLAAVTVAVLVLGLAAAFVSALYRGTTSVPEAAQAQIWATLVALLVMGTTALGTWVNVRSNAVNRQHSDTNAEITREKVHQTEQKVTEVIETLHNGLKKDIAVTTADMVEENARRTADLLVKSNLLSSAEAVAAQVQTNVKVIEAGRLAAEDAKAATLALKAQFDELLKAQAAVVPVPAVAAPELPLPVHVASVAPGLAVLPEPPAPGNGSPERKERQ